MKTPLFIVLVLLIIPSFTSAQNITYGFQAGFNLTNIITPDQADPVGNPHEVDPQFALSLNAVVAYETDGLIGFSLEPGVIKKGANFLKSPSNDVDDLQVSLYYIQLPLLLNLNFKHNLSLSVGPELSYLLESKLEPISPSRPNIYRNEFEASALIGLDYKMNNHFSTGLRYSRGLSSISQIRYTDSNGNPTRIANEHNHYGQLYLRYML